jgi:hypothetical protein
MVACGEFEDDVAILAIAMKNCRDTWCRRVEVGSEYKTREELSRVRFGGGLPEGK